MKIHPVLYLFLYAIALAGSNGCTKFPDPGIIDDPYRPAADTSAIRQRKMLFISIDGISANMLNTTKPAFIQELLARSKYTWNVASAPKPVTNAASWASMMTGNDTLRHRIYDSTFYATPVDSTNKIPVPVNLTALRHLHTKSQALQITAIAPWYNLVHTLLADANTRMVTADDAGTRSQAVTMLKTGNPDLVITEFISAQQAGIQKGFSDGSVADALHTIDGYIKEMVHAIQQRPTYQKENWMVLLTTTQGGSGLRNDADVAPGFMIVHNAHFTPANLFTLTPSISVRKEDVAAQLLYWFRTAVPSVVSDGRVWIDRFESEFYQ